MSACPYRSNELLAALIRGEFKPLTEQDREVFAGAPETALIWFGNDQETAIIALVDEQGFARFNVMRGEHSWETQPWNANWTTLN